MDRLSSCYFCGDALDASLDEYPVVPPELEPSAGARRTVVLCRGCRRKLDSVLESVLDAARQGPGGDADVESSLEGGESLLRSVGGADRETDDGGEAASRAGTAEGPAATGSKTADSRSDAPPDRETGDVVAGDDQGPPDGTGTRTNSGGRRDQPGGTADGDEHDRSGSGAGETGSESGGEAGDESEGESGSESGGGGIEPETSLTRLEYNRVMRLLQNREFPVERDGFVTVAANAYEISHRECEKILDVAVDHGLIEERDGKLVKPED